MKQSTFFGSLIGISTVLILLLSWINTFPQFENARLFTWGVLAFFILLTLGIYFAGKHLAVSKDKNSFSILIFFVMIFKMMLCVIFVFSFVKIMQPTDRFFLIPFFLIYFVYLIWWYELNKYGRWQCIRRKPPSLHLAFYVCLA